MRARSAPAAVALVTILFVAGFTVASWYRHTRFGTQVFDLGIFDQGLWLLSRFEEPFVSLRGLNLFADHSSYGLVFLVPLYWLAPHIGTLIVTGILAVAAAGPLVYLIARAEGLGRAGAASVAVAGLLAPASAWNVWDGFHPELLAIPLLLGAHLALLRRRPVVAAVLLVLILTLKEDAALVVLPYAVYAGIRWRRPRFGAGMSAAAVAAFLLNMLVLLPAWSPTGELLYTHRYDSYGEGLGALVGFLTRPFTVAGDLFGGESLFYYGFLILPLAAALLAPEVLVVAAPAVAANLLSDFGYQADVRYHYTAYALALVLVAAAVGTARLRRLAGAARFGPAAAALVVVALAGHILYGPYPWADRMPGIRDRHPQVVSPWGGRVIDPGPVRAVLDLIPPNAVVSADWFLGPQLAHRPGAYTFPNPFRSSNWAAPGVPGHDPQLVEWVVVLPSVVDQDYAPLVAALRQAGSFETVADGEVVLLRRVTPR